MTHPTTTSTSTDQPPNAELHGPALLVHHFETLKRERDAAKLEAERLRQFAKKVSTYSNDGWLARLADEVLRS
jgi:hypothetical protein